MRLPTLIAQETNSGILSMSKECVVMIRRFIRSGREQEFIERSRSRAAPRCAGGSWASGLPGWKRRNDLPPGLTSVHIAGNPDCSTFVTIEHWRSIDDFPRYVPHASTSDQDEFEAAPRQRVILTVA